MSVVSPTCSNITPTNSHCPSSPMSFQHPLRKAVTSSAASISHHATRRLIGQMSRTAATQHQHMCSSVSTSTHTLPTAATTSAAQYRQVQRRILQAVPRLFHTHSLPCMEAADVSSLSSSATAATSTNSPAPSVYIYYGSQTGTAMGFAHAFAKVLKKKTDNAGRKYGIKVVDLQQFKPEVFQQGGLHLFITACFGHGEPTDNARAFYRWLFAQDSVPFLHKTFFAFFGLGQSRNYPERYQQVTKEMDKRMGEIGAIRYLPRAEGDSSQDSEADFEGWSELVLKRLTETENKQPDVWNAIMSPTNLNNISITSTTTNTLPTPPQVAAAIPTTTTTSTTSTTTTTAPSTCAITATNSRSENGEFVPDVRHPVLVPIVTHRLLQPVSSTPFSSSHSPVAFPRQATFIEMDISKHNLKYSAGDYVGIYPMNSNIIIQQFLNRLGMEPETPIQVAKHEALIQQCPQLRYRVLAQLQQKEKHSSNPHAKTALLQGDSLPADTYLSLETILRYGVDILASPRRSALKMLSEHCRVSKEVEKLRFLGDTTSPLGKRDYTHWVIDEQRTFLDVLNAFPSIQLDQQQNNPFHSHHNATSSSSSSSSSTTTTTTTPFTIDDLLELLPPLTCRYYSIASSSLVDNKKLALVSSRVSLISRGTFQRRDGLCSSYLWHCCNGDELSIFVKPSLFRLPQDITKPIIMVCAGAGIAPFRAFIQERYHQRLLAKKDTSLPMPGPAILIYGCESRAEDYWFGDELEHMANEEGYDFLTVLPAFSHEQSWRVFAHYSMVEEKHAALIYASLSRGAHIYVCGSAARLAPGVQEAFVAILAKHGSRIMNINDEAAAATHLKKMQAAGQYQLDVF